MLLYRFYANLNSKSAKEFWYDFSYDKYNGCGTYMDWMQHDGGKGAKEWEAEELIALTRKLQPGIIIDKRTGLEADLWTPEQFQPTKWLIQSIDSKRLYIHLKEYPFAFLEMEDLADKIEYAQFLHDGSEIIYTCNSTGHFSGEGQTFKDNMVFFRLPPIKPDVEIPVIEVFLK